ncbi:MAG: autotransporter domain-containing protein, partial [Comamonadaceae bacterium]
AQDLDRHRGPGFLDLLALVIDNGASVVSLGGFIGRYNGSTGSVVVRGPGSEWIIPRTNIVLNNTLYVGGAYDATLGGGKGTLRIEDGGKVSVKEVNVGAGVTATGSVVVTGAGSVLDTDELIVNAGPDRTFRIENGGSVLSSYGGIANGMVVTGAGSTWVNTGTIESPSDLRIEKGASVSSSIVLLGGSGAETSSQLTGAGSSLTASRYVVVGDSTSAHANLSVAEGAVLSAREGVLIGRGNAVDQGFGNLTIGGDVDVSSFTLVPKPLAAKAAGMVQADTAITFGSARSHLNFNHTDTGYVFANTVMEEGQINQFAGETTMTGNADRFSGNIAVHGGKLTLATNVDQVNTKSPNSINFSNTKFTVEGGTLIVNGEAGRMQTDFLGNTAYTNRNEVMGTGVLGGTGRIGNTQVHSGGTLSPGDNSIGTLTVQGNLDILDGGNYAVDIAGNGASDKLAVTGATRLQGNTTVAVTALDPQQSYQTGQNYAILSSAGGISGTFAQALSKSAFLDVSLAHNPNDVVLSIAQKDTGGNPGNPGNPENPENPGNPGN